jgi:hypothetical protein
MRWQWRPQAMGCPAGGQHETLCSGADFAATPRTSSHPCLGRVAGIARPAAWTPSTTRWPPRPTSCGRGKPYGWREVPAQGRAGDQREGSRPPLPAGSRCTRSRATAASVLTRRRSGRRPRCCSTRRRWANRPLHAVTFALRSFSRDSQTAAALALSAATDPAQRQPPCWVFLPRNPTQSETAAPAPAKTSPVAFSLLVEPLPGAPMATTRPNISAALLYLRDPNRPLPQ